MNYGQAQAVMVLVGERMGFDMANAGVAKQVLEGAPLHPMRFADLEREAVELNNRLRTQPASIAKANELGGVVAAEYGLN